jgi:dihydrofolate reductase
MKLTASMMVTVDGVYQGPGGPDEDRRGGFERGGWTAPYATSRLAVPDLVVRAGRRVPPGRKTWEIWEPYWPHHDRAIRSPTASTSCPSTSPRRRSRIRRGRTPTSSRRLEAAVRELKAKPGRELQVHGSGVLLRWLLERDLVDELNLRVYPVIVGDGLRLFPEHGQTHTLELVESRTIPSGVMFQTYRPAGRATFGNAG